MNKLNVSPSVARLPLVEQHPPLETVNVERSPRLIVLISADTDCSIVTRRICKLAHDSQSDIRLLALARDSAEELQLRRELATLSALIRDSKLYVETKIEIGMNWLPVVQRNYREGDMIVCISDQIIGIRRRPLSQILESTLKAPIYILNQAKLSSHRSNLVSQVITWCGLIGIIAGFFVLQMKIIQLPDDWFRTVLSVLILIPELGSILFWNSLF